jgi:hypothetical protein
MRGAARVKLYAVKLERVLKMIYEDLTRGLVAVSISSRRVAMVQRLPNGTARVKFETKKLQCVAEFREGILQVNLANGKPLATVVDGEVVESTSRLRHIRV